MLYSVGAGRSVLAPKMAGTPVVLAILLTALCAWPQSNAQKPGYVVKQNVRLVIVPVTVKDRQGNLVDNLSQEDFRVFEDGHERPINFFSNESMPLSAVILIDTGMPAVSVNEVRSTLSALRDAFAPGDEEALILFDNTIRPVQDFTSDGDALLEAARKSLPEGTGAGPSILGGPMGTPPTVNGVDINRPGSAPVLTRRVGKRLDDALYQAAQQLRTRPLGRRRVVVVISDGVNGSDNTFSRDETMNALLRHDVTVYAVSFGSGWALKRKDALAEVARETGGDIAYVSRRKGLGEALPHLTDYARNSYALGFPPLAADAEFHEIKIQVKRSGVRWIARNRFLSPPVK